MTTALKRSITRLLEGGADQLVHVGPLAEVAIVSRKSPRERMRAVALIDTGSATSWLRPDWAAQLGLETVGRSESLGLTGAAGAVASSATFASTTLIVSAGSDTAVEVAFCSFDGAHPLAIGVILGRDVLRHFVLSYSGPTAKYRLFARA